MPIYGLLHFVIDLFQLLQKAEKTEKRLTRNVLTIKFEEKPSGEKEKQGNEVKKIDSGR